MPLFSSFRIPFPTGWIKLLYKGGRSSSERTDTSDSSSSISDISSIGTGVGGSGSVSPSRECYACTQVVAPAFHSTTCDHIHTPHWTAGAGSSLLPIQGPLPKPASRIYLLPRPASFTSVVRRGPFGRVLDPRSPQVQRLNRAFLLARGVALAIDPLFFYSLSIGRGGAPCLYMDGGLAAIVTVLRTAADCVHVGHIWLQLRLAYVSRESLVVGCGKLVWDWHLVADHYFRSVKGFWFDAFVILPVPQTMFWLMVPRLIRGDETKLIMTMLLLMFFFQFLPRMYHFIYLMRRMQKVTGYIFGTIWWGFALNLIAYFIASHVAGGCWYVLAIQRVASCIKQQCNKDNTCHLVSFSCSQEVCYRLPIPVNGYSCATDSIAADKNIPVCLNGDGPFNYGIYKWALPVVSSNSIAVKILYPIFWGLMTLSTFGNDLEPTSHWLEVIFSIIIVLSGLLLFTLLIGNIQVFLSAVTAKRRKMQLRCRDVEWWMKRRQLPSKLRHRVQHYERQKWATMRGEDEMEMIKDLPEGLRRDIKRHLCLDLIKQVPLFHSLDELILDNICDRVKPLVFTKDEKIIREGDPVQKMVFIVKGHLESSQRLSKGKFATCTLGPGNFLGDELFSWCLRRPFIERLPASSATFICVQPTEAFGLDANDIRYITDHFRYKFANERVKQTARFYSSHWRTWAAVNIQLAWRRYKERTRTSPAPAVEIVDDDRRLLHYAAMFMSLRPHDHLQNFFGLSCDYSDPRPITTIPCINKSESKQY